MGSDTPKCLLPVNGKPIIEHVIDFWSDYAERLVLVCNQGDFDTFAVHGVDVYETHKSGVPNAIISGLGDATPKQFIVGLGDCLFRGEINLDVLDGGCGYGVMDGDTDFGRSYAVVAENGLFATRGGDFIEKPRLGLGCYFFNWAVLSYLYHGTGITGMLQEMAFDGVNLTAVEFRGDYLNVTYPEDLERWPG